MPADDDGRDSLSPGSSTTPLTSVVAGLLAAAVVLAIGVGYLISRPAPWSAQAMLLVHPNPDTPTNTAAGFYETLGQGQVVATYAELLRRRELTQSAVSQTSPDLEVADVDVSVSVVPDTALISVRAAADDAATAESVADALARTGRNYVVRLEQPFSVAEVGSAAGTAQQDSAVSLPLVGAIGVLAVVAGLGVQQGWQFAASRRRGEPGGAAHADVDLRFTAAPQLAPGPGADASAAPEPHAGSVDEPAREPRPHRRTWEGAAEDHERGGSAHWTETSKR